MRGGYVFEDGGDEVVGVGEVAHGLGDGSGGARVAGGPLAAGQLLEVGGFLGFPEGLVAGLLDEGGDV